MNEGTFKTITPRPFTSPTTQAMPRIASKAVTDGVAPSHDVVSTPASDITGVIDRSSSPTRMTRPCPNPTRTSIEEMTKIADTVLHDPRPGLTSLDSGIINALTRKSRATYPADCQRTRGVDSLPLYANQESPSHPPV